MSLTQNQLEQMDTQELIDLAEQEQDEFTSSPLDRALVYQLKELDRITKEFINPEDVASALIEIRAQLPAEDFLQKAISKAAEIAKGRVTKSTMKTLAEELTVMLEQIQDEQRGATEYAQHEADAIMPSNTKAEG
ncbi:hypothetical protein [Psychrobacter pygoscelis]|uniref:hypothetical protein n=1 Tax=Psychrobacter pygoscelis TaxID=2488563 RepID=UPI00103C354D|nr:hypothetical protein [Psychrobacter pygoscelis]